MKIFVGVTDSKWYFYLSKLKPEDINFWQPGGNTTFKVFQPGAPFLFKLKSQYNKIAGVGFFSSHTFLPISIAWDVFQERNGCDSFEELHQMIFQYKKNTNNTTSQIGCIVLTNPVFFDENDWIDVPNNWSKSIVQGKSYVTTEDVGMELWKKIELTLNKYLGNISQEGERSQLILESPEHSQYGNSILRKVRLGQGAFRVLITDAYTRRCSITGEKTLPVLEAAHIRPYSKSGPHYISNGILLRSDLHKLFDAGYITITKGYRIKISRRIKEEFQNGKEYYQFHGQELKYLPERISDRPNAEYIEWHNSIFRG